MVYNALVAYVRELYKRYGYTEVITPQLYKTDLFKTSGHYGTTARTCSSWRSTKRSTASSR